MWTCIGIRLIIYEHFDHDHFIQKSTVRMSYFENEPLFMSLKVRVTDIVIVYFHEILVEKINSLVKPSHFK